MNLIASIFDLKDSLTSAKRRFGSCGHLLGNLGVCLAHWVPHWAQRLVALILGSLEPDRPSLVPSASSPSQPILVAHLAHLDYTDWQTMTTPHPHYTCLNCPSVQSCPRRTPLVTTHLLALWLAAQSCSFSLSLFFLLLTNIMTA